MKKFKLTVLSILSVLFLSACIKNEEPNSEADIISCEIVENDILKKKEIYVDNSSTGMYSVILWVKDNDDLSTILSSITPTFELTKGASIKPDNGTSIDLNTPKKYTVTSEDGKWKKEYTVMAISANLPTSYSFEQVKTINTGSNKYHIFYESIAGQVALSWASGNSGFSMSNANMTPEDFPTSQSKRGLRNNCAKLTTLSTGFFGAAQKMPIAAGNLFIGSFDNIIAIQKPLLATRFGAPFNKVPSRITGQYKYKTGDVYKENNKPVPGVKDEADIYAIFYEMDDQLEMLDGTNQFSHPNIFSIARATKGDLSETDEWLDFDIPFITQEGKTINLEKLKNERYGLALVFTSSKKGDRFYGAVGSTLYIDEVNILFNK